MIDLGKINLIDLIPPNLKNDPKVSAAAEALNQQLRIITRLIPGVAIFHRIDSLPGEWVDALAQQWHVDFYDPDLTLSQRRELVKNSLAWHRRKGTPSAVEELITTIFGDGEVKEWFEYGGDPGKFKVMTSNASATADDAEKFLAALGSVVRVSAHLEAIEITVNDTLQMYIGMPLHIGEFMTV